MAKASYVAGFVLAALFFIGGIQLCASTNSTSAACIQPDRNALLMFKASLQDPSNLLSSWEGQHCCHWKGVTCDQNTGHVIKLRLRKSNSDPWCEDSSPSDISDGQLGLGNISLMELKHLRYLDLSGNNFQQSEIPKFFGSLNKLRYLNLSCTRFSGKVPYQLGNLTGLQVLDLRGFFGAYADNFQWASSLLSLQHLDMSGVDLGSAHNLMEVLTGLPSLQNLQLSGCRINNTHFQHALLNSTFIATIQNMSFLRVLDISENSFNSSVPLWLGNLKSLVTLDLGWSKFYSIEGGLSSLINNYCHLKSLDLSGNRFHGEAFGTGQNLSRCVMHSLESLSLGGNEIGGQFPNWLAQLRGLQHLDLNNNQLSGVIPNTLQNMSLLRVLDISQNSFNSSVPLWLGNLKSLVTLNLGRNEFDSIEGGLSSLMNNYCHLKSLHLSENRFHGEAFGTGQNLSRCVMHSLESLSLGGNEIGGQFPNWLAQLRGLQHLDLSSSLLSGVIPNTLQNMSFLRVLDISQNSFNSSVPLWLGNLKSLVTLELSSNKFDSIEGGLSSLINNYCHLKSLDLSGNRFHGEAFGTGQNLSRCVMHSLESLSLAENEIGWQLPNWLGQLRGLQHLDLSFNLLHGPIPSSLCNLSNLRFLSLSDNQLSGVIPKSLGQLVNLEDFSVNTNSLEGTLSEIHFSNLSRLKWLHIGYNDNLTFKVSSDWIPPFSLLDIDMQNCKIEGSEFPQWLHTQEEVTYLYLRNASISGIFPMWLQSMPLSYLDLSENRIKGSIPNSLCKLNDLRFLDLSRNMLHGQIPDCWADSLNIEFIDLSSNKLLGTIPVSIGNLPSLGWLLVNNNSLSGKLPLALINCSNLISLDLGENNLSGIIPTWIGEKFWGLQILRLRENMFTGTIPLSLCRLSHLRILDLGYNSLMGRIPLCFSNLSRMMMIDSPHSGYANWNYEVVGQVMKGQLLEYTRSVLSLVANLDLSSNKLVGHIPDELTTLVGLRGLNLSHNNLSGSIPRNIGNMTSLESLDLSDNQLSGTIPNSMSFQTSLSYLNLSHNKLSGRIPKGNQLQTLTNPSIYAGNQLCGDPLPNKCPGDEEHVPPPMSIEPKNEEHGEGKSEKFWFYFVVSCGYATGLWGVIGILIVKKNWRIAYFRYADKAKDWVLMMGAVQVARLKRKMERNNNGSV